MNDKLIKSERKIENKIVTIRNNQVMLDYHLAELYGVATKRINEQVKRNIKRFPDSFMFQLNQSEWEYLQSQFATTKNKNDLQSQIATKKRRTCPYVFTEQGVAMLSAVLNSNTAIKMSIEIIHAFVNLRHVHLEKKVRIDSSTLTGSHTWLDGLFCYKAVIPSGLGREII